MSAGLDAALLRINNACMSHDWRISLDRHPNAHKPNNPFILTMNQEVHYLKNRITDHRAVQLRKLYIEDFLQEERELREVGLAYIDTQQ